MATSNVASAARLAAQAADRRAVVAKATATKTATPKATPKTSTKVLATPKVSTPGVSGSNSQFGPDTPWAKAVAEYGASQEVAPVDTLAAPEVPAWSLETDPAYRSAMAAGESSFNYARNAALAEKQNTETAKAQERKALDVNATESRRRLAGNYAARGMAGGAAGALSQAEARANAEQIAARTNIQDQISAVNNQFLQNFGDVTNPAYDWTGTLTGQQYKTQATQQAIQAALARYGTV